MTNGSGAYNLLVEARGPMMLAKVDMSEVSIFNPASVKNVTRKATAAGKQAAPTAAATSVQGNRVNPPPGG